MKWVFAIALLIFSILSVNQGYAHVSGAEIGWKYLGKDTVKITVRAYRDCNQVNMSSVPISLRSSRCGTRTYTTSKRLVSDVTPVCKKQCTRCTSSGCTFKYGYQLYELTTTVVLSDWRAKSCCSLIISWAQCCRKGQATTGSGGQYFYIDAELDLCSSQPLDLEWEQGPLSIICLGRDYAGFTTALTNDLADSIVYSFTYPKISASSRTTWTSGYSFEKPLTFLGFPKTHLPLPRGLHYDSLSGKMAFRPMKEERTIITTKAEVYRKGQKVGQTIRDILLVVIRCPNSNPPVISGAHCSQPKPDNFVVYACEGQDLCFTFCATDKDKADVLGMQIDQNIMGATGTVIYSDNGPKALFCWKPSKDQLREEPYHFWITANDSACPIEGKQKVKVIVYARRTPKFEVEYKILDCGKVQFIASDLDTQRTTQYIWNFGEKQFIHNSTAKKDTIVHTFNTPGQKETLLQTVCKDACGVQVMDTITIPNNFVHLSSKADTTVCRGDTVTLKTVVQNPNGRFKVKWSTGDSATTLLSSTKKLISVGQYIVATVSDQHCTQNDSILVQSNALPDVSLPSNLWACPGDVPQPLSSHFDRRHEDTDTSLIYQWFYNGQLTGDSAGSIEVSQAGVYQLVATDSLGCTTTNTSNFRFKQLNKNFALNDTLICVNTKGTFTMSYNAKGYVDWQFGINDSTGIYKDALKVQRTITNSIEVALTFNDTSNQVTCTTYDTFKVEAALRPTIEIDLSEDSLCNYDTLSLNARPKKGFYTIFKRLYTTNPIVLPMNYIDSGLYTVEYQGTDSNGCQGIGHTSFRISKGPVVDFTLKDSILKNRSVYPEIKGSSNNNYTYIWKIGKPVFKTFSGYKPKFNFDTSGVFHVALWATNQTTGCIGKTSKRAFTVFVPTGIKEAWSEFTLFPNPTENLLHITRKEAGTERYSIVSVEGKTLASGNLIGVKASIDVSLLPRGLYFLSIETHPVQKFIVEK